MILCCGEALIDMLPRETTAGEAAFAPYAGGAVFNTAIALGRLGAPAGYFGGLSNDLFGQLLASTLTASNVDHTPAARSDRPTTLAFVTLEELEQVDGMGDGDEVTFTTTRISTGETCRHEGYLYNLAANMIVRRRVEDQARASDE